MQDDDTRLLDMGMPGKAGVKAARARVSALAARVPDPDKANRIEAGLNDAWLRLQLARLTGDLARIRAERLACERLLSEAAKAEDEGAGKGRPS
jgi:hypothetical protein